MAVEMILKIVPTMDLRVPVMVADEAEVVIEAITAMIEKAAIGRGSIKEVVEEEVEIGGKKVEEGGYYLHPIYILSLSLKVNVFTETTEEVDAGMNQALLIKIGQSHFLKMNVWRKNFLEIVVRGLISINMKTFQLKQLVMMYPLILTL